MKSSSFQIILLAIFGAFAVAGVLIFAFLVGSNSSSSIGAVTIWGTFDEAAMQTILRQMSEEDTRLRQVTYVEKNEDTYANDLTNALASGNGPDLFFLPHDNAYVDSQKIAAFPYETFSKEQFNNLFVEATQTFLSPEGVVAVPVVVDPYVLFWNRDMLAAAGFAKPPAYWNEVYDMARVITDCQKTNATNTTVPVGCDDSRSIKRATIGFGEYRNVDHAKHILGLLIQQAGGTVTRRDSTGALTPTLMAAGSVIAQPGESAVNYFTSFANPALDAYSWNRSLPSSRTMFGSGGLALYVGRASEEALIRRLNPNLNFAIAPMPQIKNVNSISNMAVAYGLAIPKATKNPAGAQTVAFLLASPAPSKAFATVLGMTSARRDVLSEGGQGNEELFIRQTLIARTWEDPDPAKTDEIFRDMIESITSGAAKIVEALQRGDQAMRQLTQ